MTTTPIAHLLIVDDEAAQVAALCQTLTHAGYATTGSTSPAEALRELSARRFDILITDLLMPEMDGLALLRAAHATDPDLVGVMMTGHGTIDTAVEAMKSGALDYILKPFNLNVIRPVLARALALRHLRVENAALLQRVSERTAELEAANRTLQAANRELEAYTFSISHELRQPLHAMIGFSDLLLTGSPGALSDEQMAYLREICNGGKRLMRLTEELLQFSRLGQRPMAKAQVNVGSLVLDVLRELRNAEPQRNVDLRVGKLPDAQADPTLLCQVFTNLLSNALKFTRHTPDATIEIGGQMQGGECVYHVRDNGAGFDAANAARLFGIFCRLHRAEEYEGNGVGLSLVQRVVERHGGRVSAESEVGKGARFTFTLPV